VPRFFRDIIPRLRRPTGLFRTGWRELLNDFFEARIATQRIPTAASNFDNTSCKDLREVTVTRSTLIRLVEMNVSFTCWIVLHSLVAISL
jgi:hypothetical protein